MTLALGQFFNWQINHMYEEVFIDGGQADLIFVSRAQYATEVEIKTSVADWKADSKKKKWAGNRESVKYFYYAVPDYLESKIPAGLPRHAGIVIVHPGGQGHDHCRVVRPPQPMNGKRIDPKTIEYWNSCYYHRFMRKRFSSLAYKFNNKEIK